MTVPADRLIHSQFKVGYEDDVDDDSCKEEAAFDLHHIYFFYIHDVDYWSSANGIENSLYASIDQTAFIALSYIDDEGW